MSLKDNKNGGKTKDETFFKKQYNIGFLGTLGGSRRTRLILCSWYFVHAQNYVIVYAQNYVNNEHGPFLKDPLRKRQLFNDDACWSS